MNKKILFSLIALVIFAGGYGQSQFWRSVESSKIVSLPKAEREAFPTQYKLFSLDYEAFKTLLATAPARGTAQNSSVVVAFPTPTGEMENFTIYEASVMHPELAAKFPGSKSYVGQSIDDASTTIRFSTTMFGLHAMRMSAAGTAYIDTYTTDLQNYIVYDRKDITRVRDFTCHVVDEPTVDDVSGRGAAESLASDGIFRTYRLAMASTIEYSAFHVNAAGLNGGTLAQKKAAVLAAMVVTMTRVNGVYERDMSLTMQLIPNNEDIIFITTDSFDNNNTNNILLSQSQTVIDNTIGSANYDIGHTVSTGGGGVATPNTPCTASKARGVTGLPAPVGDPFDIDYVAHEMGHQFGSSHTYNNECGGNVVTHASYEPGSGSTIMAYAGICAPNVQNNSDAYFHWYSIQQMTAFISGVGGTCPQSVANGNAAPDANAGPDFIIPKGTAFILKGSASDANGDDLTYSWEQRDNQLTTQPPLPTATTGPNFRSQVPSPSPNRYMPEFSSVLAGNLTPTWEVVPNVARTMNFALTVRDNRTPNGGQTDRDDMSVTTASVGPFVITGPSEENVSWTQNSTQTVTWDVAGTTANGINTSHVNILFSSDAGATFTPLVSNTPNDGSESITVPNIASPYNRIMIEAVGNIFYAVSKNIAVGYTVTVTETCTPFTATPNANVSGAVNTGYYGYQVNVPANIMFDKMTVDVNITHPEPNDLRIGLAIPGSGVVNAVFYDRDCPVFSPVQNVDVTFDDDAPALACVNINAGNSYAPIDQLSQFVGMSSQGTWNLAVADATAANNGTLNSFTLTFCTTTTTVTLANDSFEFADFAVYPNPNNGNFTVRFDNESSNDVMIMIHDIRGRQIFENKYQGGGLFNQEIQLNDAAAGVYLMTVSNGEHKTVKRIVVE